MIFRGNVVTGLVVTAAGWLAVTGCSAGGLWPSTASSARASSSAGPSAVPRAALEFRPVLVEGATDLAGRSPDGLEPGSSAAPARPTDASDPAWVTPALLAELARLGCSANGPAATTSDPAAPRTACSTGPETYLLGPAELIGADVAEAKAEPESEVNGAGGSRWTITLTLTEEGRQKFGAATRRLAGLEAPRNQFAVVVDGRVLMAPRVVEPITGGVMRLSGDFDRRRAEDLAARLGG